MADDVEMTPISPAEGGSVPPKVSPFGAAPAAAAPSAAASAAPSAGVSTIKLKPVIRKPMIHKPTIGAKPPMPPAPPPAVAKKATQNLKSVTGPIPVQATLKKTGIIAEGIITPQQQQAAKSKTSRISLESAIGVAPAKEGPAPLKTIRLRRPTDLKPAAPSPIQPQQAEAAVKPAPQPAAAPAPTPVPAPAPVAAAPEAAPLSPIEDSVTQKKTLKLHRPGGVGIKPPSIGIQKPAADGVQDIPDMGGDVPELSPLSPMDLAGVSKAEDSGAPSWLVAISAAASLATLLSVGYLVYELYCHIADAGANEIF